MNEQNDKKTDRKKDKKKRLCLRILALIMLLFVPVSAYASEIKSDGKTTQAMEEENKTVRVGYFPYANFQEGGYGEHKQGAGYEYLQKISSLICNSPRSGTSIGVVKKTFAPEISTSIPVSHLLIFLSLLPPV